MLGRAQTEGLLCGTTNRVVITPANMICNQLTLLHLVHNGRPSPIKIYHDSRSFSDNRRRQEYRLLSSYIAPQRL